MIRIGTWVAVCLGAAATPAFGFQAAASIEGQVVHASTGSPLKRATVRLAAMDRRPNGPASAMALRETDDQGRFAFTGLEAGRYRLTAERQGFLRQSYGGRKYSASGASIVLAADQRVRNIVFKLSPHSVIAGKVLDEDGEAVASIAIRALKSGYRDGRKEWVQAASAMTNDLGEYRIAGLEPGKYLVGTSSPNRTMGMLVGLNGGALPEGPETRYAATFYPNVPDEAGAAPVEVPPTAEVRGIDIRLARAHVFRIRGRVAVPDGGRNYPIVTLMTRSGDHAPTGVPSTIPARPPEYRFEIGGVSPGSYLISAHLGNGREQLVGFQAIEVRGGHVDGLVLNLAAGGNVAGTIRVTDAAAPVDLKNVALQLRPSPPIGAVGRARVSGGAFTFTGVLPQHHTLAVNGLPENCFVRSIRYGGRDLADDGVDITAGAEFEIILSATAGEIAATVVDGDGKPSPAAVVALVPKGGGPIRGVNADDNGAVSFRGLKPGDYLLLAWDDIAPGAYADPEFVKPYEGRGQTVKVEPSGKQAVQLKVIPAE